MTPASDLEEVPPSLALKLSAIIPVYDERFLVRELISRVLAVSVPEIREIEPIVVDDGSQDGSLEILRQLAREHPERIRLLELSGRGP